MASKYVAASVTVLAVTLGTALQNVELANGGRLPEGRFLVSILVLKELLSSTPKLLVLLNAVVLLLLGLFRGLVRLFLGTLNSEESRVRGCQRSMAVMGGGVFGGGGGELAPGPVVPPSRSIPPRNWFRAGLGPHAGAPRRCWPDTPLVCAACPLVLQAVKEKVVNFAMFKAVFASAVLGDQLLEEVFVWVTWFSVVGLLNVVALLCRLRLDAISVSCCAVWAVNRAGGREVGVGKEGKRGGRGGGRRACFPT
jgi:hypothetical protein